jgi:GT2 family glycosyltransferase
MESASIIILNYNGKRFLHNCFTSVLNQTYSNFEIIFFDNNSIDDSAGYVRSNFEDRRITIVETRVNLGFAGGNNEALRHAKNDLIVLLNNDTEVDKDWLKNLVNAVKEGNTVASSMVITEGIDPEYYKSNGSVSYLMYNVMKIFKNPEDEFYPNGCSVIFRKSEIPVPFDSDYFYYSEDLYLGLKARFMGMNIKFAGNSIVRHYGGGAGSSNSVKTFYQERNRLLNLYTFFSFSFIIRILPVIWLVKSAKLFLSVFTSKHSFIGMLKAYLWFYFNIGKVLRKRRQIKSARLIYEKEIVKYMTSKLLNHTGFVNKTINRFSYLYSRLVGIKPIEYYKDLTF